MQFTNFYLLLLFCICSSMVNAQTFVIEGKTNGYIPDGSILYLGRWNGMGPTIYFTSAVVKDGTFYLKGELLKKPDIIYLYGTEKTVGVSRLRLWIGNDTVRISANSEEPATWNVNNHAKEQNEENIYQRIRCENNLIDASRINSRYLWDKTLSSDSIKSLSRQMVQVSLTGELHVLESLYTQPKLTEVGLLQFFFICGYSSYITDSKYLQMAKEMYARLSEIQKQTYYGKIIKSRFFPTKTPEAGDYYIDAKLMDFEGNTYKLTDYLNKGKHILLDFWDYPCNPCLKSVSGLKELALSYPNKLTIISINTGNRTGWEKGSHDFTWLNFSDGEGMAGIASRYGVRSIPYFILIAPNGRIEKYWKGYGRSNMEDEIAEIIK